MRYEEERVAVELYKKLKYRAWKRNRRTVVSLEGPGASWICKVKLEARICTITCFWRNSARVAGAEYISDYESHGTLVTTARTPSDSDAIAAAVEWVNSAPLEAWCHQFNFVEGSLRSLLAAERILIETCPTIEAQTERVLNRHVSECYRGHRITLRAKDRWVQCSYHDGPRRGDCVFPGSRLEDRMDPEIGFFWDEFLMFRLPTHDFKIAALVIQRWLCDYAKPSQLEREFPWVKTGKLAKFFEHDQRILGEYLQSWDWIEKFYQSPLVREYVALTKILAFIKGLRARGYDEVFRAGQSLTSLILSRSRRHGLRPEQPRISFGFAAQEMYVAVDGELPWRFPTIELTPEINEWLMELEAKPID